MPLRALFTRSPDPQTIEIVFDGAVYAVGVRRHRQARRYTLRIHAPTRSVLLTMPLRGGLKEAKAFAQKNGGWIAARLKRLPETAPFAHGETVPLRGAAHRIAHRPGARGTVWTETRDGEELLCVAGDAPHIARRLNDYFKREAKRDLDRACQYYAHDLGVVIERVSVRDQVSRWGSCSSQGVLSFSWRLVLAPPFVLDYLAAHEVAHLVEMSHSRKFWRLLGNLCASTDRAKAWLAVNGADLHRYGGRG